MLPPAASCVHAPPLEQLSPSHLVSRHCSSEPSHLPCPWRGLPLSAPTLLTPERVTYPPLDYLYSPNSFPWYTVHIALPLFLCLSYPPGSKILEGKGDDSPFSVSVAACTVPGTELKFEKYLLNNLKEGALQIRGKWYTEQHPPPKTSPS